MGKRVLESHLQFMEMMRQEIQRKLIITQEWLPEPLNIYKKVKGHLKKQGA